MGGDVVGQLAAWSKRPRYVKMGEYIYEFVRLRMGCRHGSWSKTSLR